MSEASRAAALRERATRVIKYAKHSVIVSQVVDNTTVSVKIECKSHDNFKLEELKRQINAAFSGFDGDSRDAWDRADALYLLLNETYNDNKISISVSDSSDCGVTANYYNTLPQQLIKI